MTEQLTQLIAEISGRVADGLPDGYSVETQPDTSPDGRVKMTRFTVSRVKDGKLQTIYSTFTNAGMVNHGAQHYVDQMLMLVAGADRREPIMMPHSLWRSEEPA